MIAKKQQLFIYCVTGFISIDKVLSSGPIGTQYGIL